MKQQSTTRSTSSIPQSNLRRLGRFLRTTGASLALLGLNYPASAANPTYQAAVLANTPYFYYELGETNGTFAYDVSGNNFTAAYVNGPNALPGGPTLGVAGDSAGGPSDTAVHFAPASLQYVEAPLAAEAFGAYMQFATYEFVYKTTNTIAPISLSSEENNGSSEAMTIVINQNAPQSPSLQPNNVRFFVRTLTAGNSVTISFSNALVCDGNYHHLVFTFNGTNTGNPPGAGGTANGWTSNLTSSAYFDGVLQTNGFVIDDGGAQPPSNYGPFGVPIVIGTETAHSATALADYFDGTIDEVAYYTNVLSPLQILANYNALVGQVTNDVWTGAVSANWDTSTANWTNTPNTNLFASGVGVSYNGDPVTFGDSASSFTVNVATNVSPVTMTFSNSANNYTIASPGGFSIGGVAALTTVGSGTVTFLNTNTFTGPIVISAGTVVLGGTAQLQNTNFTGNATYNGDITDDGTFTDASTSPQTLGGFISGTGTLLVNASGAALTLSNANSYTGPTIVGAGTLLLSGAGSIASSPSITVSNGAVFDVSGVTGGGTLGANQNLLGFGSINGALATTSDSEIFPGSDGAVGTLTFSNNLTLDSSSTVNFDVLPSHSAGNDKIVVDGALTLNGNSFHLKALNPSLNLDTTDYVLMTAASINGFFFGTPVFDVPPANAGNYSIVTGTTTVTLHYNPIAGPSATGTVAPTNAVRNGTVSISVTVTPGNSPTVSTVTVSSSALGGAPVSLSLSATPNVWTNTIVIPPAALPGLVNLEATATDGNGLQGFATMLLRVSASTEIWNGLGVNASWDTNSNWTSGFAPGYAGDRLVFAGTTGLTPVLDQAYTVQALTFSNTAGAFNLTNTNSLFLTLAPNSGVTNLSATAERLNLPVQLAGVATFAVTTPASSLVLTQPVGEVTPGAGVLTIAGGTTVLDNTNTYTGNTVINAGALTIGPGGLLGNGNYPGNIVIAGTNSFNYFSGVPQIFSGVIAGSGPININGGGISNGPIVTLNALNTYIGNVTISNTYVSDIQGDDVTSPAVSGVGNPLNLNQTFTINSNAIMSFDVANPMGSGGGNEPLLGWIINRGGVLQNTVANFGIGPVTLNGGTLAPQNGGFELDSTVTVSGTAVPALISNTVGGFAGVTLGYGAGGGTGGTTTFTVNKVNGTSTLDLTVAVPMAGGGLSKAGAGTMVLTAANTYAGNTTITAGTLVLADPAQLGGGAYSGTISNNGTFISTTTSSQTFGGLISGTGVLEVSGVAATNGLPAALTLSGNNTSTGVTLVTNGATLFLEDPGTNGNVAIGAGSIFDLTEEGNPYAWNPGTTLTASGTSSNATINGVGGQLINLSAVHIILNYDGSDPALTVTTSSIALGTNLFTVNTASPLAVGPHTIMTVTGGGTITDGGSYPFATGSAIPVGKLGTISVNGANVVLTIGAETLSYLSFASVPVFSRTNLTISGTNAGAGTVYLLTTTNLAPPITWTPLWTNFFSGSGSFTNTFTNAVVTADRQQFYILSSANH